MDKGETKIIAWTAIFSATGVFLLQWVAQRMLDALVKNNDDLKAVLAVVCFIAILAFIWFAIYGVLRWIERRRVPLATLHQAEVAPPPKPLEDKIRDWLYETYYKINRFDGENQHFGITCTLGNSTPVNIVEGKKLKDILSVFTKMNIAEQHIPLVRILSNERAKVLLDALAEIASQGSFHYQFYPSTTPFMSLELQLPVDETLSKTRLIDAIVSISNKYNAIVLKFNAELGRLLVEQGVLTPLEADNSGASQPTDRQAHSGESTHAP
jgi:hypothetical protein